MFRPFTRTRVTVDTGNVMVTKQSHKNECDINHILTQFKRTGILTHITQNQPIYADLPSDTDFQTSLNTIMQADNAFATLPSVVRRYFDNDPARLLAALGDPSQRDKLVELGVLKGEANPRPPGNPENRNPLVPLQGTPTLPATASDPS